jgi:hypothetical protein
MSQSIREFLDSKCYTGRPLTTDGNQSLITTDWNELFKKQKFYSVDFGHDFTEYKNLHEWCNENIGSDHYIWTGSKMWFDTEQSVILFSLRWL